MPLRAGETSYLHAHTNFHWLTYTTSHRHQRAPKVTSPWFLFHPPSQALLSLTAWLVRPGCLWQLLQLHWTCKCLPVWCSSHCVLTRHQLQWNPGHPWKLLFAGVSSSLFPILLEQSKVKAIIWTLKLPYLIPGTWTYISSCLLGNSTWPPTPTLNWQMELRIFTYNLPSAALTLACAPPVTELYIRSLGLPSSSHEAPLPCHLRHLFTYPFSICYPSLVLLIPL